MPYIPQRGRLVLDTHIGTLRSVLSVRPRGDLNYTLTRLVVPRDATYANYESAIGVLEAVKLELYRRMVAPYEDAKKNENGDVF